MIVKIGVIDSGFDSSQAGAIVAERNFTTDDHTHDRIGHGTAVIGRILTANVEVEICLAKVFSDRLTCPVEVCVEALEWMNDQAPQFINMSFGLQRDDDLLRSACERLIDQDIGLVAASPAQGANVYPSAYPGVVRATGDARCAPGEIAWLASEQADVAGYVGDPKSGPAGASIGCASVSARLAGIVFENPLFEFDHHVELLAADAEYQGVENKQ